MDMNFEIKLIKEVRNHNILYDWGSEGYRNPPLKEQHWRKISAILDTDVEICKRKWRTLRDTYKKTKQRDDMELRLGKKPIGCRRPWKYSKYLSFLDKCKSRFKRDQKNRCDVLDPDSGATDDLQVYASDDAEEFEVQNDAADSVEENELQHDAESAEEIELQNDATEDKDIFKYDPDSECFLENRNYSFIDEDPIVSLESPKKDTKPNLEKCLIATMNSVQDFLKRPRETITNHTKDDSEDELFCRSMMRKLQKFPLKKKNEAKISIMRYLSIKESDLDKKIIYS